MRAKIPKKAKKRPPVSEPIMLVYLQRRTNEYFPFRGAPWKSSVYTMQLTYPDTYLDTRALDAIAKLASHDLPPGAIVRRIHVRQNPKFPLIKHYYFVLEKTGQTIWGDIKRVG